MAGKGLTSRLSSTLLPNSNSRTMCPPGPPVHHGRPNVVVATPMRSGTHLLIDLLLNNIAAYRTRPLYVNLDLCVKQSTPERNLVAEVSSDAGHVVKTHMPVVGAPPHGIHDPEVLRIVETGVVVTVRRPREDVIRSLRRWGWGESPQALVEFEQEWDRYWDFWTPRETLSVEFAALLDPTRARAAVQRIADLTGTRVRSDLRMPLPASQLRRIYVNKGLTRLVGRYAPRIDTTIETLKR